MLWAGVTSTVILDSAVSEVQRDVSGRLSDFARKPDYSTTERHSASIERVSASGFTSLLSTE
jgi:hypothetical protein